MDIDLLNPDAKEEKAQRFTCDIRYAVYNIIIYIYILYIYAISLDIIYSLRCSERRACESKHKLKRMIQSPNSREALRSFPFKGS